MEVKTNNYSSQITKDPSESFIKDTLAYSAGSQTLTGIIGNGFSLPEFVIPEPVWNDPSENESSPTMGATIGLTLDLESAPADLDL